ncbi:hypothetical protein FGO68_gene6795 [Halteria grandinella]|uniref:Uncharacterized protein n=1 Tax=Halteria grandinella TaxID=5974 RepID=A0A8J8NMI9_HALGN|nr:hypothetical protein FGO68_gene6795 [Halteria grandinella]
MSLCMLLFMYVLYSLCRIAFNYKTRDALTTSIQILFCVSLFFRSLQIASNLISKDDDAAIHQSYVLYVIFFYIADFLFESAIILQMCLWLDISVLITYQKPGRFQNQDTQKSKFNEFERKRTLVILGLGETLLLIVNVSIATLQVGHCNQMTQRYIDIANLSTLIIMEIVVGALFVSSVKGNRSSTWVKTRIETYAIIAGIISSFALKIVIKATHKTRSQDSTFGKDSAVSYHVESFLQFVLSEFLLIAVWTWFKAPEDFFSIYNNLPISKFSIFQRISGESKSDGGKTPCGGGETDTGECNGRSESLAELQGDGRGNGGGYRDSLLSGGRDQRGTEGGDFGGSIGKRSI